MDWKIEKFKVGDVVTRNGVDRHRVIQVDDDYHCMIVKCLDPGPYKYMAVGEEEHNLCSRYEYAVTLDLTADEPTPKPIAVTGGQ